MAAAPAASASPTVCTSASSKLRELEWEAAAEPRALEFSSLGLSRDDFGSSARLLAPEAAAEASAHASAAAACQWQSMVEGAVLEFRRDATAIVHEFLDLDACPLQSALPPFRAEPSLPSSAPGFPPTSAAACASEHFEGFGEPWKDESLETTHLPSTMNGDAWTSLSSTFPGTERSGFRQSHAELEPYTSGMRSPDKPPAGFGQWQRDFDLPAEGKRSPGERSAAGAALKDAHSPYGAGRPRSPRVDDTMDEVTRHLMHARDKIEAVELEFAQIMGELASYGERWGDGSGASRAGVSAWEEPQAGPTEYFCINTPTPNKPGLFAFPPTGSPVELPRPLETGKLAPAMPE